MTTRVTSERGLSLVEASIILGVLSVLASILAPAGGAYLEEGRNIKAAKDVQAIGAAIDQTMRDTGLPCLSFSGTSCTKVTGPSPAGGRVELLISGTSLTANDPVTVTADLNLGAAGLASAQNVNWAGGATPVGSGWRDLMDNQFVSNGPAYAVPTFTAGGGPRSALGWRGPYLTGPIDLDPWGYAYQASTLFLTTASDATDGTGSGQKRGGWNHDVVVISAGSNATVQTPFGSSSTTTGTKAIGDDIIYVVQGSTR